MLLEMITNFVESMLAGLYELAPVYVTVDIENNVNNR